MSRWEVGEVALTAVVEAETPNVPPEIFFPAATAEQVAEHPWLVPDYAAADGTLRFRVQAFVVEAGARTTTTRLDFLKRVADDDVLVLGTHFPTRPAGHLRTANGAFRFHPV